MGSWQMRPLALGLALYLLYTLAVTMGRATFLMRLLCLLPCSRNERTPALVVDRTAVVRADHWPGLHRGWMVERIRMPRHAAEPARLDVSGHRVVVTTANC